jgi:uncharacterized protein
MTFVANLIETRAGAWVLIVLTLLLGGGSVLLAGQVEQDDDLLAFLPEGNEEIETFYSINERFGSLDVALIGIGAEDVFEAEFLTQLREVTERIGDTKGVNHVLSLANVDDFTVDPMGGVVTDLLVSEVPTSDADREALRDKVMSRDQVVGNLVAANGKGVLLYVFVGHGAEPRLLADDVRAMVQTAFPNNELYWGGAPYISTYIYDTTQADMARLTPFAVAVIVLIILLSFRDLAGSILALVTTAMGIVVSRAAMAALGVSFNIVLSSMPVILFAVGSAYSIHMLSRYYANVGAHGDKAKALRKTVVDTGPTVIAAGLTTVAGLLSFVMMDIKPMRTFGLFTALGIFTTLILSVTFVPAVIRVAGLNGWKEGTTPLRQTMIDFTVFARGHRRVFGVLLLVIGLVGGAFVGQVDNRMDQGTFFAAGSPPDLAQHFLDDQFGGSQFLQVEVRADMEDPAVLREVQWIADQVSLVEHVSSVNHISAVVSMINEAMDGIRRVPDQANQVGVLYGFLAGRPSVGQLVTEDKTAALLHIKIGSNSADVLDSVLASVGKIVADRPAVYRSVPGVEAPERVQAMASDRIRALSKAAGISVPQQDAELVAQLNAPVDQVPPTQIRAALVGFLVSEECFVELDVRQAEVVAAVLVPEGDGGPSLVDALAEVFPDEEGGSLQMIADDIVMSSEMPLESILRRQQARYRADTLVEGLALDLPTGDALERYLTGVSVALVDMAAPAVLAPDEGEEALPLGLEISGLPVMYAGMSESVTKNQFNSLAMALGMVLVIMTVMFRSPFSGLLATIPTALTLLVVYGGMGWLGVHLDIGTSMLGSIIIGAGVDYAVHLLAAWRGKTPLEALRRGIDDTAPAIWTNALMVAAGFYVLTLGDAKPLQNVGGLTAAAMVVAALATFVAIPVLAQRSDFGRSG